MGTAVSKGQDWPSDSLSSCCLWTQMYKPWLALQHHVCLCHHSLHHDDNVLNHYKKNPIKCFLFYDTYHGHTVFLHSNRTLTETQSYPWLDHISTSMKRKDTPSLGWPKPIPGSARMVIWPRILCCSAHTQNHSQQRIPSRATNCMLGTVLGLYTNRLSWFLRATSGVGNYCPSLHEEIEQRNIKYHTGSQEARFHQEMLMHYSPGTFATLQELFLGAQSWLVHSTGTQ